MRRCSLVFLVFVVLSALAACTVKSGSPAGAPPPPPPGGPPVAGPPPASDPCPQELGADAPDNLDGAPSIEPGTHQGCYGVNDAKDSFALTAPAHAGPVLYRLRVASAQGHACLVAYNADRAVVPKLERCAQGPGAALEAWVVVMGGSPWFLQTRDLNGNALRMAEPYTLDIQATPLDDPGEPDSMESPVPLALGEARQAYLINAANAAKLDNDYYVVEVPKDQKKKTRFDVSVTDVPADVHVALVVHDGSGKQIYAGSAPNPGAALRADVKMKGPGKYIFHLRNVYGTNLEVGGVDDVERIRKPYTITVNAP